MHLHAFAELFRSPRLVEEGALERASAVVYVNLASGFGAAFLPLSSAEILLGGYSCDFSYDHDFFVWRVALPEVADFDRLAAVYVAEWIEHQQIQQRLDAEGCESVYRGFDA